MNSGFPRIARSSDLSERCGRLQSNGALSLGDRIDAMSHDNVNPTSEHELYLKLFITNGGGW